MKNLVIILISLGFTFVFTQGISQNVKFNVSDKTTMTVSGTSTLHDWTSTVNQVKGFVEINDKLANNAKAEKDDVIKSVEIRVPVDSIISPRGAVMDKKTYEALKSKDFPEIVFKLSDNPISSTNGTSFTLNATGDLTIAGITKHVEFPVEGKFISGNEMSFTGSYKLNMVDYNMEPPSAMFGQIVTGEEVTINFELIATK